MSHLKVIGAGSGYTLISNIFIDYYMITSGSSHLKTYLLLIRLLTDPQKEISISGMADILDCSESDVLRSLRHWEGKGLMKLRYQANSRELAEIQLFEPQVPQSINPMEGTAKLNGFDSMQMTAKLDGFDSMQTAVKQNGFDSTGAEREMLMSQAPAANGQAAAAAVSGTAADLSSSELVSEGISRTMTEKQSEGSFRTLAGGAENPLDSTLSGGVENPLDSTLPGGVENPLGRTLSGGAENSLEKSFNGTMESSSPVAFGEEEALPPRQVNFAAISADEKFSQLMFIAEQYIGTTLSRADCETFAWLYDGLKMNPSLLEYLVESCVTNGHRSVRYMETVALDWHRKKITTVEQARIYTPLHHKNLYAVMKALGLNGRQPAPSEQKIIDRWFREYQFSLDMVIEACNRTMISIHEPNLNYVESILSRWKKAGISSLAQVQGLDEQFQKMKEENQKGKTGKDGFAAKGSVLKNSTGSSMQKKTDSFAGYRGSGRKPGAQFHDFDQRTYDYDALLKQINAGGE